ncbi:MAG: hypothetical protein V3S12_03160, partial [Acidiferrobacterales bacterium]
EPLKNVHNEAIVDLLSDELTIHHKSFDAVLLKKDIFNTSWNGKELKDLMHKLAIVVHGQKSGAGDSN